jgi:hypothetical protein
MTVIVTADGARIRLGGREDEVVALEDLAARLAR